MQDTEPNTEGERGYERGEIQFCWDVGWEFFSIVIRTFQKINVTHLCK